MAGMAALYRSGPELKGRKSITELFMSRKSHSIAIGMLCICGAITSTAFASIQSLSIVSDMNALNPMTVGFSVSGTTSADYLLRFSGPSFGRFGVSNVVSDPKITLFKKGTQIGFNDNWEAALELDFTQNGLTPFFRESKDAALKLQLSPGDYVARFDFDDAGTKQGWIELSSISERGFAQGYVESTARYFFGVGIKTSETTDLLVRARDVSTSESSDTRLLLQKNFGSDSFSVQNDNWRQSADFRDIASVSSSVGFGGLGELDSAIYRQVPAGSISAIVSGNNLTTTRFEFADAEYEKPVSLPDGPSSLIMLFGSLSACALLRRWLNIRPN